MGFIWALIGHYWVLEALSRSTTGGWISLAGLAQQLGVNAAALGPRRPRCGCLASPAAVGVGTVGEIGKKPNPIVSDHASRSHNIPPILTVDGIIIATLQYKRKQPIRKRAQLTWCAPPNLNVDLLMMAQSREDNIEIRGVGVRPQ